MDIEMEMDTGREGGVSSNESGPKPPAVQAKKVPLLLSNFNFKGGVSKTTTTFNLGWLLSKAGKKVLLVDTDPQCNLTQVFTAQPGTGAPAYPQLFEPVNLDSPNLTLGHVTQKILHSRTLAIEPVNSIPHRLNTNLLLLPGHVEISMYETGLADAVMSRRPGSRHHIGCLFEAIIATAKANDIDFVLIDSSPSLSLTNNLLVMFSHYWVVPCQADFFSCMAITSMHQYIPEWINTARNMFELSSESVLPLPEPKVTFIGGMVQMFTVQNGQPSNAHQEHINQLNVQLREFGQFLRNNGLALAPNDPVYEHIQPYIVCQCQNFNRFAPMAQTAGLPVAGLLDHQDHIVGPERRRLTGSHLERAVDDVTRFIEPLNALRDMLLQLRESLPPT